MWILFILVFVTGEPDRYQELERYSTRDECVAQQQYVRDEMHRAYPNDDEQYMLDCKPSVEHIMEEQL